MNKDKKKKIQEKFLETLKHTPIVEHACDTVGISRNTIYRWKKESPRFRNKVEESLSFGVDRVNDFAESNILNEIKSRKIETTKWWLSRRHSAFGATNYRREYLDLKKSIENQNIEKKQKEAKKKIMRWQKQWFKDENKN